MIAAAGADSGRGGSGSSPSRRIGGALRSASRAPRSRAASAPALRSRASTCSSAHLFEGARRGDRLPPSSSGWRKSRIGPPTAPARRRSSDPSSTGTPTARCGSPSRASNEFRGGWSSSPRRRHVVPRRDASRCRTWNRMPGGGRIRDRGRSRRGGHPRRRLRRRLGRDLREEDGSWSLADRLGASARAPRRRVRRRGRMRGREGGGVRVQGRALLSFIPVQSIGGTRSRAQRQLGLDRSRDRQGVRPRRAHGRHGLRRRHRSREPRLRGSAAGPRVRRDRSGARSRSTRITRSSFPTRGSPRDADLRPDPPAERVEHAADVHRGRALRSHPERPQHRDQREVSPTRPAAMEARRPAAAAST